MNRSSKEIFTLLKGNIYVQLVKRLLVIYLLYSLCRLVFYWYNLDYYGDRTFGQLVRIFLGGMRFDTTAILYTNLLYILMFLIPFRFRYNYTYQKAGKYIYFITNAITLAANCMDTVYFRFTMRRTTFNIFKEFSNGENLGGIFGNSFIENWYLILFFIGLVVLMVWFYGKPVEKSSMLIRNPFIYYPSCLIGLALSIGIIVIGLRGGVRHSLRPITLSNAGQYAHTAIDVPLILNTPFALYKTIERKGIQPLVYFDDEQEMDRIYTPVHQPDSGTFKNMNVMVIILESFGKEHVGFYNKWLQGGNYKGYTPFLDSLAAHSLAFDYSYANGTKSIDALASAMVSVPAIPEPFVLSPHFDNAIRPLPELLKEKGYQTAFFCGHPNGAMGYAAFCNLIGIEKFYGMNEYGNTDDFDGIWGIWDEEFLQFTANEMSHLKEPFMTTLFTVSSHHPFILPPRYENTFEPGDIPLQRCIRYSDFSLRKFFKTASRQPWYNNTLFVLMADHINGMVYDEYNNPAEFFAVPVMFYKPDGSLAGFEQKIVQQLDVMPTILGYLNYDLPYFAFGFDVNKTPDRFAVNYLNGFYQLYYDHYLLQFDGSKTLGLYDINELREKKNNDLSSTHPEIREQLEPKMKAFLQQYTTRMVNNKLTVNP